MLTLTEDQVNKLDMSVDHLEWSTRARNILKMACIKTVRDLVGKMPQELMRLKWCGNKTVGEIAAIVKELGFKLGMELPVEKISGVSIVELAVAFATRSETVCTWTDPSDGRELHNCGLRVYLLKRRSYEGDSSYKYDVEAELLRSDKGWPMKSGILAGVTVETESVAPITVFYVLYDERKKEGRVERK